MQSDHIQTFFKGIIDDVRIYSRALSQSEIEMDMIPEFPSFSILLLFLTATLLAVIVYRRKCIASSRKQCHADL